MNTITPEQIKLLSQAAYEQWLSLGQDKPGDIYTAFDQGVLFAYQHFVLHGYKLDPDKAWKDLEQWLLKDGQQVVKETDLRYSVVYKNVPCSVLITLASSWLLARIFPNNRNLDIGAGPGAFIENRFER